MNTLFKVLLAMLFLLPGPASVFFLTDAKAAVYPNISGDNTHEWITNVTFRSINNSSARNWNGYGNYTYDESGIITRVRPGRYYSLSITIHPDLEWCEEYLYAFFDWNRDGDFTDSGERLAVAPDTCSPGPHTATVRVPWSAVAGETRMRIVLKFYTPPLSYGKIPEGEAEDYSIFVEYPTVTGDNRSEWITNVTIGDIGNTTGQETNGFGDYTYWATGRTTEIVQDETYTLSVTISPDTTYCAENLTAFLDWNQDGDFADYGEKVDLAVNTCSPGPHVKAVRVPTNAAVGSTRMRIILRWLYPPSISGYISGEGEDYTLLVQQRKFPWPMFLPATTGMTK